MAETLFKEGSKLRRGQDFRFWSPLAPHYSHACPVGALSKVEEPESHQLTVPCSSKR